MKCVTIVLGILLVVLSAVIENRAELTLATPCNEETCKLPDCRCSNSDIPGGLDPRDTPQFVLLTFDDAVHVGNIETYRSLYSRRNKNGCPAGISFYVSHQYTNYAIVNELYSRGYEIALHSITHSTPISYWEVATHETLMHEFADQRKQMTHFAHIPAEEISGIRLPFLQMSGNISFQMMQTAGFTYDISWPTSAHVNPGLWPYTLDYASIQDCMIGPCPTASLPGPWVLPMITWFDLQNFPCSFVDACIFRPDVENEEEWFEFIMTNFERHYKGNRAPFGFYVHEWFLSFNPAVRRAFDRFLDLINNLHDTFMVTGKEVIDWTRNPVKLDEYVRQPCRTVRPTPCTPRSCGPLRAEHTTENFYMQTCGSCPRVYPWLKNPFGEEREEE